MFHKKPKDLEPRLWDEQTRLYKKHNEKFIDTYRVWNRYGFSGMSAFGNKMRLAHLSHPATKEEWEARYFASGEEYKRKIKEINKDSTISKKQKRIKCKDVGLLYGRTFDQIQLAAKRFHAFCQKEGLEISPDDALNFTYIRTIDESWIGYQREVAAAKDIDAFCRRNGFSFEETNTDTDVNYGVDYEIFDHEGKLVCGVQVKGAKYRDLEVCSRDFAHVNRATAIRNIAYEELCGVPVLYIFVDKELRVQPTYRYAALQAERGKLSLDDRIHDAILQHDIKRDEIRSRMEKNLANDRKYECLETEYCR